MGNKDILKKTTATNLWLRIMVGGFLVYLACSIGAGLKNTTGNDTMILGAATVLFAVSGAVIAGWSFYRLAKRDYYDPVLDDDSEEAAAEDAEETSGNDSE